MTTQQMQTTITQHEFGLKLCEQFGISPAIVRGIDIHIDAMTAGAPVIVEFRLIAPHKIGDALDLLTPAPEDTTRD